jgi:pyruvate dehydrogenase kinase 2/3/4
MHVDDAVVKKLAKKQQVPVSLRSMVDTGTGKYLPPTATPEDVMVQVATFLHKEMPVRMSHRIIELDTLPYGLCDMPSIKIMRDWYHQSLSEILAFKTSPNTYAEEEEFKEAMQGIYERHNDTLLTTARGLYEFKNTGTMAEAIARMEAKSPQKKKKAGGKYKQMTGFGNEGSGPDTPGIGVELADLPALHEALDQFLMCRMGIRVLLGQYLALHPEPTAKLLQFRHLKERGALSSFTDVSNLHALDEELADVGMICMRTQPAKIAANAAADAADIFERQLPDYDAPEVVIIDPSNCIMSFIPSHLYYILFELIKNSMRATAEAHKDSDVLPPVMVIIGTSDASEDVAIKVSDQGGGIPRKHVAHLYNYLFTTAPPEVQDQMLDDDMHSFGR